MKSFLHFYDELHQNLKLLYPKTCAEQTEVVQSLPQRLFFPAPLRLPRWIAEQAAKAIGAFAALHKSSEYQSMIASSASGILRPLELETALFHNCTDSAVLMAFDFHWDGNLTHNQEQMQNSLKLIEINTNASLALLSDLLYRTLPQSNLTSTLRIDRDDLFHSFVEEFNDNQNTFINAEKKFLEHIFIVDNNPVSQKMYIEFLLYRELFQQKGLDSKIISTPELKDHHFNLNSLIYNRDTDFFLTSPESQHLRKAWLLNQAFISPHPRAYFSMAHKHRLIELAEMIQRDRTAFVQKNPFGLTASQAETIEQVCLESFVIEKQETSSRQAQKLWADRKKYFFKPISSFGSKAVYSGKTVRRSLFENILQGGFLAQTVALPARLNENIVPELPLIQEVLGSPLDQKFDIRFFVYKDRIQGTIARVYHGPVMNFINPGGGIAGINWVNN